jgi:hypothetical protein
LHVYISRKNIFTPCFSIRIAKLLRFKHEIWVRESLDKIDQKIDARLSFWGGYIFLLYQCVSTKKIHMSSIINSRHSQKAVFRV